MDGYGRVRREGSQPDPYREWGSSGQETGLEEGVWQLQLGAEGESGYPERPEEPNCIYYLRTGFCGYGSRCRFNHPRDRAAVLGAARGSGGDFPERAGQPVCQYYIRTGGCKFGASCKYHHPKEGGGGGGGSSSSVQLNYHGYPLRPGEKECTYYLKTGQCKFANTCKFHHPMPANVQVMVQPPEPQLVPGPPPLPPSAVYSPVQSPAGPSSQQYGIVVRPSLLPGFVSTPYGPFMLSHGVYPSWAPYPAPATPVASPGTQLTVGSGTMYGLAQLSPSSPGYASAYLPAPPSVGPSSSMQQNPFPERPGQPECQYYMKTGECKYGSLCRYHHPLELMTPTTNVVLSPMGLPLRPDAPPCMHYAQRGQCKFGAACRFDHPMGTLSYSPSASSLTDMPVAPYPVGSSMGTLAPSSSSSDLRPELTSGSTMGSGLNRMSSSTQPSISSCLAASPATRSGNAPRPSVHQPNQGAALSSSNPESHSAS